MRILFFLLAIFLFSPLAAGQALLPKPSVHPTLPLTLPEHLVKCEDLIDYEKEFQAALSCSVKKFFKISHPPLKKPNCFVITDKSPDLQSNQIFSYLSLTPIDSSAAVGFYEPRLQTLFIADNYDMAMIIRHELQHHFLHAFGMDGDAAHSSAIWEVCEPPQYTPSKEAVADGIIKFLAKKGLAIKVINAEKELKRLKEGSKNDD